MIRKYEDKDYESVRDISEVFWEDAGTGLEFEEEAFKCSLNLILNCGFAFVAQAQGKVVGYIGCIVVPMMASNSTICSEAGWFVLPDYRGTGAGIKLFKRAEAEANKLGCHIFSMTYMETSMPEEVKSLYEKCGLELQETTYRKILWQQ